MNNLDSSQNPRPKRRRPPVVVRDQEWDEFDLLARGFKAAVGALADSEDEVHQGRSILDALEELSLEFGDLSIRPSEGFDLSVSWDPKADELTSPLNDAPDCIQNLPAFGDDSL